MRMLIYSHDTFGLGHLRRCLKISQALKAQFPDLSILLVTGSPQVHRYRLPAGLDYIKLPAVRKTADEQYEPRSIKTSFRRIFNLRSRLLLETTRQFSPHILLVDHSPLGMKGEIKPSLEWLKSENPETFTILGLRDIIDEPEKVVKQWQAQSIYDSLREFYDGILIYGCPIVFDPVISYEFPEDIARKTSFCGYISEPGPNSRKARMNKADSTGKFVTVTSGGGDGAGEAVVGTFMEMLKRFESRIDFNSLIITGPFISEELWRKYRSESRRLPVAIRKFVGHTRPFLQKSDLVISTGGYNTTTEILTFARRALIIPRILYRNEQLLRAQRLRDLGLVSLIHPDNITPETLFDAITEQLLSRDEPLERARINGTIQLNGAEQLAEYCRTIFSNLKAPEEISR